MQAGDATAWVEAYIRAWTTNDPADISGLFAEDALYYTAPFRDPWRGRDEIIEGWLDRLDQPGTWDFKYEVLAVAGEVAFVRGWTKYVEPPKEYSNLWVIRLDGDARCSEFTEWWMEHR